MKTNKDNNTMQSEEPRLPLVFDEAHLRVGGPLKRAEDWERLTRLEYVVEAVAKEHERQARELSVVVQTQRDMISHLKIIKFTVIGGLCGMIINQIGIEKTFDILSKLIGM